MAQSLEKKLNFVREQKLTTRVLEKFLEDEEFAIDRMVELEVV